MKTRRRGPVTWLFPSKYYPPLYGSKIVVLGSALLELVAWDAITPLVRARSLDAWIDSLPFEEGKNVRVVLGLCDEQGAPDSATNVSLKRLASAFKWMRRFDDSVNLLSEALERDPEDTNCRYNLAICLSYACRPGEALTQGLMVAKQRPDDARVHYFLGNILIAQGDPFRARDHYLLSTKLSPDHAYSYYKLGVALQQCGDHAAAGIALTRAIKIGDEYIANCSRTALAQFGSR